MHKYSAPMKAPYKPFVPVGKKSKLTVLTHGDDFPSLATAHISFTFPSSPKYSEQAVTLQMWLKETLESWGPMMKYIKKDEIKHFVVCENLYYDDIATPLAMSEDRKVVYIDMQKLFSKKLGDESVRESREHGYWHMTVREIFDYQMRYVQGTLLEHRMSYLMIPGVDQALYWLTLPSADSRWIRPFYGWNNHLHDMVSLYALAHTYPPFFAARFRSLGPDDRLRSNVRLMFQFVQENQMDSYHKMVSAWKSQAKDWSDLIPHDLCL